MEPPEINVGIFVAHAPTGDRDALEAFAEQITLDTQPELEAASGLAWRFHKEDATQLSSDDPRPPSDFLDEASLRMVEGPFDVVVVVTDVVLVSRNQRAVPGLVSAVAHIVVISTRRLVTSPRGEPLRSLRSEAVRWNAANLLVHLFGHLLGLRRARVGPMAPFRFDADCRAVTPFPAERRQEIAQAARDVPDHEHEIVGALSTLRFHMGSALRHPRHVLRAVWRSRAPALPLALPGLATAAVAPTLILVFSAEIWDVGLNMSGTVAWSFAVAAVVAAAVFLVWVQNLVFPRKDRRVITEHMAVVNVAICLMMLLAMVGLFVMLGALMLVIELYVFPPDLMTTWPTLEDPEVTFGDKVRLAAFMSTIGVVTGALAGGLESRTVIRHLALFRSEP